MIYQPTPEDTLHRAVEKVCERNPRLVLMPYEQMKAAALQLARDLTALRASTEKS